MQEPRNIADAVSPLALDLPRNRIQSLHLTLEPDYRPPPLGASTGDLVYGPCAEHAQPPSLNPTSSSTGGNEVHINQSPGPERSVQTLAVNPLFRRSLPVPDFRICHGRLLEGDRDGFQSSDMLIKRRLDAETRSPHIPVCHPSYRFSDWLPANLPRLAEDQPVRFPAESNTFNTYFQPSRTTEANSSMGKVDSGLRFSVY